MRFSLDELNPLEDLKAQEVIRQKDLLDILDLNAEQLTYYLEDQILENPFIELEYALETPRELGDQFQDRHLHKVSQVPAIDTPVPHLPQSLPTFLFEQILLYRQTPIRDTMVHLVDELDERGYLPLTYQEVADLLEIPEMVALDAMTLLKQLEPAGVGAYDLQEALMLQTEQDSQAPPVAYYLLEVFFDEITREDYASIQAQTQLSEEEIMDAVHYYHTLRPSPASIFDQGPRINLMPDLYVKVSSDREVELDYNRQGYPKLSFNWPYYEEMRAVKDPEVQDFIADHEGEYLRLEHHLQVREKLILALGQALVQMQGDFFLEEGQDKKPLMFSDLARALNLPEAVVRLLVHNKNLAFKDYVLPLADFINPEAPAVDRGLSAGAIRQRIETLLVEYPDWDNHQIAERLGEDKVIISERMVQTYREGLDLDQN